MCFGDGRLANWMHWELHEIPSTVVWGVYLEARPNRVGFMPLGGTEIHVITPRVQQQAILTGISVGTGVGIGQWFLYKDLGRIIQDEWSVSGFNPGQTAYVAEITVPHEIMAEIRELGLTGG